MPIFILLDARMSSIFLLVSGNYNKTKMEVKDVISILVPMLLIVFGFFIKSTSNENYQNVKSWGKILVIIGIVSFILKLVSLFLK